MADDVNQDADAQAAAEAAAQANAENTTSAEETGSTETPVETAPQTPEYELLDADESSVTLKWSWCTIRHPIPQELLDNPNPTEQDVIVALNKLKPNDPPPAPEPLPAALSSLLKPTHASLKDQLITQVDNIADAARYKLVGDGVRAFEYRRTEAQAKEFVEAGYPEDKVPETIAAWAINGRTAKEAADEVMVQSENWNQFLYLVRAKRLAAKEAIRLAFEAGKEDDAKQAFATYQTEMTQLTDRIPSIS